MYDVITIERRYASGGHEIGKKLAEALGYKLYDRKKYSAIPRVDRSADYDNVTIPRKRISPLDAPTRIS